MGRAEVRLRVRRYSVRSIAPAGVFPLSGNILPDEDKFESCPGGCLNHPGVAPFERKPVPGKLQEGILTHAAC